VAAFYGYSSTIVALVTAKADVNSPGQHGSRPLFEAVDRGETRAMQTLLDLKADPSASDYDGRTALHTAAYWGRQEIMQSLLQNGAHISVDSDKRGHALCRRAQFCIRRASQWDTYDAATASTEMSECQEDEADEVLSEAQALHKSEQAIGDLIDHCGRKNQGPRNQAPKRMEESQGSQGSPATAFEPDAWRGEDFDRFRGTPASSYRPSTAVGLGENGATLNLNAIRFGQTHSMR